MKKISIINFLVGTAILAYAQPSFARYFYFKGTMAVGHQVIGLYDNIYYDTCIKLGDTWLVGGLEYNDIYKSNESVYNKQRLRFYVTETYRKIGRGVKVSKGALTRGLYIKSASTKPTRYGVLSKSQLNIVDKTCLSLPLWSDTYYRVSEEGDGYFEQQRWAEAIQAYTRGISI